MSDWIERHVLMTCDREHEDAVGPLYYFKLYDRMPGPYKTQLHRKAIIDVAADGTLAGVELIDDMPPPPKPADPPSTITELFGERCADYDPDCATCFAHMQLDEILRLRAENEKLQAKCEFIYDELLEAKGQAEKLRAERDLWISRFEDFRKNAARLEEARSRPMRLVGSAAAAALKETGDE